MAQDKKYISLTKLKKFLDNAKNTFAAKQHTHKTDELLQSENHLFVTKQEKDYLESKVGIITTLPFQSGSLIYNGSRQSPVWNSFNENELTISGQTYGTNAGSYVTTFTPVSGRIWFDGTSDPKNVTWTIQRAVINKVPIQTDAPTYNRTEQSPTWVYYEPSKMTIGGTIFGTNAGNYTATFTPTKNYKWSDGSYEAKQVTWVINRMTVEVPYQTGSLTYTGTAQRPSWGNYNSEYFTMTGSTTGINAGVYTITFTPKSNYKFADGLAFKQINWTISKADSKITPNFSTSVTASKIGEQILFRFSVTGTGKVSLSIRNPDIVNVPNGIFGDGNNYSITAVAVGKGKATIVINVAGDSNYNATSLTVSVTVNADIVDPILGNNTPEKIQEVARSGQAANIWSVGDAISIHLDGRVGCLMLSGDYYAYIIGFNHNSNLEGNNTIHFQFGQNANHQNIAFVDSHYGTLASGDKFCIDKKTTNAGGWNKCYMRNTICKEFLVRMPFDWQNVIAYCNKYTDNLGSTKSYPSGNPSAISSTQDKIFLLSEYELCGRINYSNSYEANYQKQYTFYANGNSKKKYKHSNPSDLSSYWLRSLSASNDKNWCYTDIEGYVYDFDQGSSEGFAPCFVVA